MPTKQEVREGLREVRRLVSETHWIQGSYLSPQYLEGDGVYEDGAVVMDTKVVGCLVGLARLVGAKQPSYVERGTVEFNTTPAINDLSRLIEQQMIRTIREEFIEGFYDEDDDLIEPVEDLSIEGWNDANSRTKDQVLDMLDRAIERSNGK